MPVQQSGVMLIEIRKIAFSVRLKICCTGWKWCNSKKLTMFYSSKANYHTGLRARLFGPSMGLDWTLRPSIYWNSVISFFLNFGMMLETHMKLCVTTGFFGKILFAPNCHRKQGFLKLLKNLVINFYWFCFIMKIYIICWVPDFLRNFLFLRYGPKCSQPIRLQDFYLLIFPE